MKILKIAGLYFLGFFVSLLLLEQVASLTTFIESPYKNFEEIAWGALYFTFFFTLFDHFILKRLSQ
ncbi:MAG: hypothetical protein MK214_03765 [Thalassotalea sp.]|nr:hypothetical protein [Thalassotalea sp.]